MLSATKKTVRVKYVSPAYSGANLKNSKPRSGRTNLLKINTFFVSHGRNFVHLNKIRHR